MFSEFSCENLLFEVAVDVSYFYAILFSGENMVSKSA